ncbi:hypothetical protein NQZ68_037727 [Dissostichus eleginoides]|nr:hypothetical protein NQZ68_037727 [Dissostichus eleginoides]
MFTASQTLLLHTRNRQKYLSIYLQRVDSHKLAVKGKVFFFNERESGRDCNPGQLGFSKS